MSCQKKQMEAEFFKNSDHNFDQKSRWLQLISMTLIKVLDLKMSQFQKKQMSSHRDKKRCQENAFIIMKHYARNYQILTKNCKEIKL